MKWHLSFKSSYLRRYIYANYPCMFHTSLSWSPLVPSENWFSWHQSSRNKFLKVPIRVSGTGKTQLRPNFVAKKLFIMMASWDDTFSWYKIQKWFADIYDDHSLSNLYNAQTILLVWLSDLPEKFGLHFISFFTDFGVSFWFRLVCMSYPTSYHSLWCVV